MFRSFIGQCTKQQKEFKAEQSSFMKFLHQRLGTCTVVRDLVELTVEDTPQYNSYEDELQNAKTFPMLGEKSEVTSEWGYQYVNANLLLLRGNKMARG